MRRNNYDDQNTLLLLCSTLEKKKKRSRIKSPLFAAPRFFPTLHPKPAKQRPQGNSRISHAVKRSPFSLRSERRDCARTKKRQRQTATRNNSTTTTSYEKAIVYDTGSAAVCVYGAILTLWPYIQLLSVCLFLGWFHSSHGEKARPRRRNNQPSSSSSQEQQQQQQTNHTFSPPPLKREILFDDSCFAIHCCLSLSLRGHPHHAFFHFHSLSLSLVAHKAYK